MTPTQKTLKWMRSQGYHCEVVEHWVPFPKPGHRKDLLGFIDVLCIRGDDLVAVQTTAASGVSSRLKKIKAEPRAGLWLAGIRRHIQIHGWKKGSMTPRVINLGPLQDAETQQQQNNKNTKTT